MTKKSNRLNLINSLVVALFCAHFSVQAAEKSVETTRPSAKHWLESEANNMLAKIDQHKSNFNGDEKALQKFLYETAIPFWDTRLMARRLGGQNYRHASSALKNALEEQWKLTLVRYFFKAYPYYKNQRLSLEDEVKCPSNKRCWLKTKIDVVGKKAVDLDFYVRWHKNQQGISNWMVIDLRVAGVSLLKHKRGQTRGVLKKQGIAGVIAALKIKNSRLLLAAVVPGA